MGSPLYLLAADGFRVGPITMRGRVDFMCIFLPPSLPVPEPRNSSSLYSVPESPDCGGRYPSLLALNEVLAEWALKEEHMAIRMGVFNRGINLHVERVEHVRISEVASLPLG